MDELEGYATLGWINGLGKGGKRKEKGRTKR